MKNPGLIHRCFSLYFLQGILLFWLSMHSQSAKPPSSANESDQQTLLEFKTLVARDPFGIMDSWNESHHFCNWNGVECEPSNGRVVSLNLEGLKLAGSMPPSTGNLTFLTRINLKNNSFNGEIPPQIGRLSRLQHLNLSFNSFEGVLPSNLSHCKELRVLNVNRNQIIGQIPDQLSSLAKLEFLGLGVNNFTGKIPAWIGNFSSLQYLYLSGNSLTGRIPEGLGHLSSLEFIDVHGNYFSGTLPASLFNISSLFYISVADNQLHGQLPPNVGLTLPNLQIFAGGANQFTGPIPVSITNASGLQILDFAQNSLNGTIPRNIGYLQDLTRLNFDTNLLENGKIGDLSFFSSLANCTSITVLGLGRNAFRGQLPSSIGNLSKNMQIFTLGGNLFHGSIPAGFGNLVSLFTLGFEINSLSGKIPDDIGRLHELQVLALNGNRLSGPIPTFLGNLSTLGELSMDGNSFEGTIPPSLGNCKNLIALNLSYNYLTGTIPREIFGLSSLSRYLAMSHNSLTGSLPSEVDNLWDVEELDFSDNKLSGEIPGSLGSCSSLERLYLQGNAFAGSIPTSLKALRGLQELDVSSNNLSGRIPEFLSENITVRLLNLSWNNFEGEVPTAGIYANISGISIFGNDKLCGGIPALHLPACSGIRPLKSLSHTIKIVVSATCAAIFVLLLSISFLIYNAIWRRKSSRESSSEDWQSNMTYADLLKLTSSFFPENLIGSGSFGSVYKGNPVSDGPSVAIKVINLRQKGASKTFTNECNALRSIRHRNLLKIITACSTVDLQGNEFKALVFEFMVNGNLDKWIQPGADEQYPDNKLSLIQRLNIAIDIASALDYLHHNCPTSIVHCDLKPNNVLLDEDMVAHVADFGLARFLSDPSNDSSGNQTISRQLKGSIGYIPPEYGMREQPSTSGDAYSYGILLLEMFTGKMPTDDMFKDDMSIRKFVEMAFPEHVMDVADPRMLFEEEKIDNGHSVETENDCAKEKAMIRNQDPQMRTKSAEEECLVSVLEIGLLCSATSPADRITMTVAVNRLQAIRQGFLKSKSSKRRNSVEFFWQYLFVLSMLSPISIRPREEILCLDLSPPEN